MTYSVPTNSRLVVKNLPKNCTEKKLRDTFGECGDITDCRLAMTPDGKFRRFAYIGFNSAEEAQRAKKHFDQTFIGTLRIRVRLMFSLDYCATIFLAEYLGRRVPGSE